jgi:hypothetical protein
MIRPKLETFLSASLPDGQRKWHWLVVAVLALLLANTLFMLARRYGFGCSLDAVQACRCIGLLSGRGAGAQPARRATGGRGGRLCRAACEP